MMKTSKVSARRNLNKNNKLPALTRLKIQINKIMETWAMIIFIQIITIWALLGDDIR